MATTKFADITKLRRKKKTPCFLLLQMFVIIVLHDF